MTNRRKSLPPVSPKTPAELRPLVAAIAEIIETGEGVRGDPLDRKLTLRDLIDAGVLTLGRGGNPELGEAVGGSTTVGALSNLTANGAFKNIILAWEGVNQTNYSYTEIWRGETDNLANAVLVGVTPAAVYADPVSDFKDYYYWVRAVSTSGNPGPYNATAGTVAKIAPDYETVRDFLTATDWQASTAYSPLDSVVPTTDVEVEGVNIRLLATNAGTTGATEPDWGALVTAIGDTVTDGTVIWEVVEAGKIPFYIDPATGLVVIDGAAMRNASIDSAKIGSLSADKIFAASGTIAEALIGSADITTAMIADAAITNAKIGFAAIGAANIGDAAITNAKIGDAAITTLKLAGQAVTFPIYAQRTTTFFPSSAWSDLLSISFNNTNAFNVPAQIIARSVEGTSGTGVRLVVNGAVIETLELRSLPLILYVATLPPGTSTIAFQARDVGGSSSQIDRATMSVVVLKR